MLPAVLVLALACAGDGLTPPAVVERAEHFWDLDVNERVVTLSTTAPYDTVRITAVPRNHRGEVIPGLPTPRYWSANPEKVLVSAEGLIVAQAPTDRPVMVLADLTVNNQRHLDTVFVKVVNDPNPPVLTSFSIQPVPPEVAAIGAKSGEEFSVSYDLQHLVRAADANGTPIADALTWFEVSDPFIAYVEINRNILEGFPPNFLGLRKGTVTLRARTNLFGVVKTDSVQFEVTWPTITLIQVTKAASGTFGVRFPAARLAPNGVVGWVNITPDTVSVEFTDPTHIAPANTSTHPEISGPVACFLMQLFGNADCTVGGNFTLIPSETGAVTGPLVFRVFPDPGVYEYHILNGGSGTVIVE